jgi:hypothetical protein
MITYEALKLHLTDAYIAHQEYELLNGKNPHWADWWAEYLLNHNLEIDQQELAMFLREADSEYHLQADQEPYLHYLAEYISAKLY